MMGEKKHMYGNRQKTLLKCVIYQSTGPKKNQTNQLSLRLEGFGIKNREALNVT